MISSIYVGIIAILLAILIVEETRVIINAVSTSNLRKHIVKNNETIMKNNEKLMPPHLVQMVGNGYCWIDSDGIYIHVYITTTNENNIKQRKVYVDGILMAIL